MKTIYLKSYGIFLNGREEGRSAYMVLERELKKTKSNYLVKFDGVLVLAPSWCDEFFGQAQVEYPGRIRLDTAMNPAFERSFSVVEETRKITFEYHP